MRAARRVAIFGATSAIGAAVARHYAQRFEAAFFLAARDAQRLSDLAADLQVRGAKVETAMADASGDPEAMVRKAVTALGAIDVAILMQGALPDQAACEAGDARALRESLEVNVQGTFALALRVAAELERQRAGTLVLMGSAAGDRGRRSNYIYGAAKAAVEEFASGLRARLQEKDAHVLLVKPGLVDTPMTAAFRKGPLWSQPGPVGRAIGRAIEARRNVVYAPWFWRPILWIIRLLPWPIFRRLKI
jgi:short-subunit dehydrogenase